MKKFLSIIVFIAMVVIIQSCVVPMNSQQGQQRPRILVQFSEQVRNDKNFPLTLERLDSLQFFNGPVPIILKRSVVEKGKKIINGELITPGVKVYVDTIKPFTKGVMVEFAFSEGIPLMRISFEKNDDTKNLVFGPDENGNYVLYGMYGKNEAFYGNSLFQIISGKDGTAKLYFDPKSLPKQIMGRVVPGREVNK